MNENHADLPAASTTARALTRRSVVRVGVGTAWAAPVVTMVSAAPAFAAVSPGPDSVLLRRGASRAGESIANPGFTALIFEGLSITPSQAVAPGGLRLTVRLASGHNVFGYGNAPAGWTVSPGNDAASLTFIHTSRVKAGDTVALADGAYGDDNAYGGRFIVTVQTPRGSSDAFAVVIAPGVIETRFAGPPAIDVPVITFQGGDETTIGGATNLREKRVGDIPDEALDMNGDPHFRYLGFPSAKGWTAAPQAYVETPFIPGGNGQFRHWDFQVELDTDAPEIEFRLFHANPDTGPLLIMVNDRFVTDSSLRARVPAGGNRTKLTFPDSRPRRIRMICGGDLRWAGVAVAPAYAVTRTTRSLPNVVAFIGDSLTAGADVPPEGGTSVDTCAYRVGYALGADYVVNAAIGGTRYVPSGSGDAAISHFGGGRLAPVLAMAPTRLVVVGSRNDSAYNPSQIAAVQEAAEAFLDATAALPDVVVVGTFTDLPQNPPVKAAAQIKGRRFIDVHDAIFGSGHLGAPTGDGNADRYITNDGVHLTLEGHRFISHKILGRITST